jgi:hypothetical protein
VVALAMVRRPEGEALFALDRDLPTLDREIRRRPETRLVVIDPITSYLGNIDSHRNADVRRVLAPLGKLAESHSVAILLVSHLNKGSGKAAYRVTGSLAFSAAARATWLVIEDPDSKLRRLWVPVKLNLAPDRGGMAYSIQEIDDRPVVAWEAEPISIDANDALQAEQQSQEERSERDEAKTVIRDLLAGGIVKPGREVIAEVRQEVGCSEKTVRRAARALGIRMHREGFQGVSTWCLST